MQGKVNGLHLPLQRKKITGQIAYVGGQKHTLCKVWYLVCSLSLWKSNAHLQSGKIWFLWRSDPSEFQVPRAQGRVSLKPAHTEVSLLCSVGLNCLWSWSNWLHVQMELSLEQIRVDSLCTRNTCSLFDVTFSFDIHFIHSSYSLHKLCLHQQKRISHIKVKIASWKHWEKWTVYTCFFSVPSPHLYLWSSDFLKVLWNFMKVLVGVAFTVRMMTEWWKEEKLLLVVSLARAGKVTWALLIPAVFRKKLNLVWG